MGLAAMSDRLADLLVPGVRARMGQIHFVTAMAVGSLACEPLADEPSFDGVSSPAICFEWLVIESLVRAIRPADLPLGIPGSLKARMVINQEQRLSAKTYLKGPKVFGFNGIYKPFAVDAGVVDQNLDPGNRCADLVRAWEHDRGWDGFVDELPGSQGGRLRKRIREEVANALRYGECRAAKGSSMFALIAEGLRPDRTSVAERAVLRSLLLHPDHEHRAELARLVEAVDEPAERLILRSVRSRCSPGLGRLIDAATSYEQLAVAIDTPFRTLCAISHSLGAQPLRPEHADAHPILTQCAQELPERFRRAANDIAEAVDDIGLEQSLGEFATPRAPSELFELLLSHHETILAARPPTGRRPWFEPHHGGWVVRTPYATPDHPSVERFVHPLRVFSLRQFMRDTAS